MGANTLARMGSPQYWLSSQGYVIWANNASSENENFVIIDFLQQQNIEFIIFLKYNTGKQIYELLVFNDKSFAIAGLR